MDRVPLPDGYELRAATLDEIPELARFIIEYDLEIGGYSDFFEDDLREIKEEIDLRHGQGHLGRQPRRGAGCAGLSVG